MVEACREEECGGEHANCAIVHRRLHFPTFYFHPDCILVSLIETSIRAKENRVEGVCKRPLTFTTPFKYPERSAKSSGRSFGAPLRFFVCDRKMDPAPFLCARMTRPMLNSKTEEKLIN